MNTKYLEALNEVLEEKGSPSKDKLMGLMEETMAFFQEIKNKMESDDPEKREEAFQETLEIKDLLESKMQALCEKTGLDPSQLTTLAANPHNMSQQEREAIAEATAKLKTLQKEDRPTKNINKHKIIG